MIAVVGGIFAAIAWGVATFASSRATRHVGAASTLAWVSVVGLVASLPLLILDQPQTPVALEAMADLVLVGMGYVGGLLLLYAAFGRGKVGIAAPIASTEGAVAACIAVLLGEAATLPLLVALGVIVIGLVVTTLDLGADPEPPDAPSPDAMPMRRDAGPDWLFLGLSVGAAIALGIGLFAGGRVSGSVPVSWVVVAGRVVGVLLLTLPLVLLGRLRFDRSVAGWLVVAGLLEVVGYLAFASGARGGIAIASVLASQFAVVAVLCAALFGEHLDRRRWVGVAITMLGVAAVALMQA